MRLLERERFDADTGSAEKDITLTACVWSNLSFNHDGEFNEVCRAYQAAVSVVNDSRVKRGLGFWFRQSYWQWPVPDGVPPGP